MIQCAAVSSCFSAGTHANVAAHAHHELQADTVCPAMSSVSALVSVLAALCASASADTMPLFSWTSTKGAFDQVEPQSANALLAAKHKDFKASVVYLHSLSTEQLAMHKDATKQM